MPPGSDWREDRATKWPPFLLATLLYALVLAAGPILVLYAGATHGVSRYLYQLVDLPGMVVVACCAVAALLWAALPSVTRRVVAPRLDGPVWPVVSATLLLSLLGVPLIYHGYALSMDEYMTRFQAEIFGSGRLSVVIPEPWRRYGLAIHGGFVSYDEVTGVMASNYRPGMAAIYALFDTIGLGPYSSAFLNAGAVAIIARVARQLFPLDRSAPLLAALLLATSQQALAASLTSYAMAAHLCMNLLWLTLFLNDDMRSHCLAALVGVATASLHQIHPHLFFALPFLLTLLRPFRPRELAMYLAVYLVGHAAVYGWDWMSFDRVVASLTAPAAATGEASPVKTMSILDRTAEMLVLPTSHALTTVAANLVRLVAWQSVALLPLLVFAAPSVRHDRRLWPLISSVVLSLLPYPFLMPDQGHGWGYRYLHGLLGCLALLAVPGWRALGQAPQLVRTWVVALLLATPFVLIPIRAVQIEFFVAPYARATPMLSRSTADIVIADSYRVLVGGDIPRNSPTRLRLPVAMNDHYLPPDMIATLCRTYTVDAPNPAQLKAMKLAVFDGPVPFLTEAYAARNRALQECHR
jgi:hypothetical protein